MTKQEFINMFTKAERLEVLFSGPCNFKRVDQICNALYENKTEKLIEEMEKLTIQSEDCKTAKEVFEYGKKEREVNGKLKKLHREFGSLR